jgi:surface-anchored protein/MYXO-CTERM domain-containing protein
LELHYHFGIGAVLDGVPQVADSEFAPQEAYVRVPDAAIQFPGAVPFLGTGALDPVWVLPQSNTSGLPFLGIAAEELSASDFASATISLTNLNGPGQVALWQSSGFGANVIWRSNDGLTAADLLNLVIEGHDHYNLGFTAEGVYELELTARGDLVGGGFVTDVGVFRFAVGSSTVIPEPSGCAALAVAAVGTVAARRRRWTP